MLSEAREAAPLFFSSLLFSFLTEWGRSNVGRSVRRKGLVFFTWKKLSSRTQYSLAAWATGCSYWPDILFLKQDSRILRHCWVCKKIVFAVSHFRASLLCHCDADGKLTQQACVMSLCKCPRTLLSCFRKRMSNATGNRHEIPPGCASSSDDCSIEIRLPHFPLAESERWLGRSMIMVSALVTSAALKFLRVNTAWDFTGLQLNVLHSSSRTRYP